MLFRSGARLLRRAAITVAGVVILAVGAVMLVAPGPGFLVLALGLFVLGLEYDWARRRLGSVQRKVAEVAELAVAKPWSTVGSVLAALALVAAGIALGVRDDLPAAGWVTGGTVLGSGVLALGTIVVSLRQARVARRSGVPGQRAASAAETHTPAEDPAQNLAEDPVRSRRRTG